MTYAPSLPLALPAVPMRPYAPASAGAYTVVIGGKPVNVIAGTLNVQNQIGQRSTGTISVWTPLGVYWSYGTQIQVYNTSGALVYAGFTAKDKLYKSGSQLGAGYLEHDLTLMDNAYKADKRVVFASYLRQSAGSIVQSLLGKVLAAEGSPRRRPASPRGRSSPR